MTPLSRRTFLRASGITLALPWLEAMAGPDLSKALPPKRFCSLYFPYGVSLANPKNGGSKWAWFPTGEGRDFIFNEPLKHLEPHRDHLTIIGNLHHPQMKGNGGHDSADTFLTGCDLRKNNLRNTISLDQVAANHLGRDTRFPSMVLSTDGGINIPTRSSTLSYDIKGQPIPSLNRPAYIFERLFGTNKDSIDKQRRGHSLTGSHLDLLLDQAKGLDKKLGKSDREKMDEYLNSVREIELQVERSARWLDVPKPTVNASNLTLDADDSTPRELIRTMLDLIVLAFQTDSTRFATYQLANMHGATSIAVKFSQLLGFGNNTHGLAHGWNKPGGAERQGKWDQWQAQNLEYFLNKLASIKEGEGTLLDNTLVYYGSSNSKTHNNTNYPLLLAGGKNMGYQHGQYLRSDKSTPLSNLYLTFLQRLGAPVKSFADSTGAFETV